MSQLPHHVKQMAEQDPESVVAMEWEPVETFEPLDSTTVTQYVKFILREYRALLHTHKGTDDTFRKRLRTFDPVNEFARKYEIWFKRITSREIVTNDRLLTHMMFQLELFSAVESGVIDMENAKAQISKFAMEAVVAEGMSRGAHKNDPAMKGNLPPIIRESEEPPRNEEKAPVVEHGIATDAPEGSRKEDGAVRKEAEESI